MFTDEELASMTYEQSRLALMMKYDGKSEAEIRAAVLPESVPEPEEEPIGIQMVRKMIFSRQPYDNRSFLEKWHR